MILLQENGKEGWLRKYKSSEIPTRERENCIRLEEAEKIAPNRVKKDSKISMKDLGNNEEIWIWPINERAVRALGKG